MRCFPARQIVRWVGMFGERTAGGVVVPAHASASQLCAPKREGSGEESSCTIACEQVWALSSLLSDSRSRGCVDSVISTTDARSRVPGLALRIVRRPGRTLERVSSHLTTLVDHLPCPRPVLTSAGRLQRAVVEAEQRMSPYFLGGDVVQSCLRLEIPILFSNTAI